jgi:hypothetical protein
MAGNRRGEKMSKSRGRQHEFTTRTSTGMIDSDDMGETNVNPFPGDEQIPEELQHEPITMPEPVKPMSKRVRYECLEHPEQGTDIVVTEGKRKMIPVCPTCGYQMVELVERKKFQR